MYHNVTSISFSDRTICVYVPVLFMQCCIILEKLNSLHLKLWTEVPDTVQESGIKIISKKKEMQKDKIVV